MRTGRGAHTETVDHPLFARFYARMAVAMERHGAAAHRRRLLEGITGRVVEIGAGTGANFVHYPPSVTELVAVEPEARLRALARRAARDAATPISVVDSVADRLPAADGTFDAAVTSLVLCSVPDHSRGRPSRLNTGDGNNGNSDRQR